MKNKKGMDGFGAVMVLLISIILFSLVFCVYKSSSISHNQCLIDYAKSYCESEGYVYASVEWTFGTNFYCKLDKRDITYLQFKFLKSELEECIG